MNHVRKIQIRFWTFCLNGSKIVSNRSLLFRAENTNVALFASNRDLCSESVPSLVHTSESNRVAGFQFFLFRFVVHWNFVLKVQFRWWLSCFQSSTIVRSRSLYFTQKVDDIKKSEMSVVGQNEK